MADRRDETLRWCVAAAGALLFPVLVLVEVEQLRNAVTAAGERSAATGFVTRVLAVSVPVGLVVGWRRGRRPLHAPRASSGASRFWPVGVAGAFVARALTPNGEVWLHAVLLVLVSFVTAVIVAVLVSRLAHR